MNKNIKEDVERIRDRVALSARRVKRDPDSIIIVAAVKNAEPDEIEECINAGIKIIGENRVQDAERKIIAVKKEAEWHMIGHLQTNKVNKALKLFSMVQSVNNLHLVEAIQKRAYKPLDVLVEVNTSSEESKFGVKPKDALDFLQRIAHFDKINLRGLMTIGPLVGDPRQSFKLLYRLFCDAKELGFNMKYLSMGMTDDFEIAIEEGSNMVRVGRAIFQK
ncbi:MAG: YggS family pyridoxal phosphate-dependent enzyme [bacterium (Candidatus Stahlbacteria) CG23_combo_of_CG06-09_8_20_14_all_40_9]|nr:MAG: YggS family pyridoxal phosphate-dependent enzyme [bacterium (Candidatus Stahlbacteria) CG23_combo_of_CG06-09_8_20_14_all_40_9]